MLTRSVALVVMVGLGMATVAHAESDRERATRHVGRGVSYFEMGKYQQAIEEFERAYVLYATDSLLFNLAQAHRKLDQCAEALSYYERFLARSPSSSLAREVRTLLPELRRACDVKFDQPVGVTPPRDGSDPRPPAPSSMALRPGPSAAPTAVAAVTTENPPFTETAAVTTAAPRPDRGLRLFAAPTIGGLVSASGQALALGLAAGFGVRLPRIPVEVGASLHLASYGWSSHGLDGRSGVIGVIGAARWMAELAALELQVEAGAGVLALSHLQAGNPLRKRGTDSADLAVAPAAQGGVSLFHGLGERWGLRLGATALLAAAGSTGVVGDLRLVAGVEVRP